LAGGPLLPRLADPLTAHGAGPFLRSLIGPYRWPEISTRGVCAGGKGRRGAIDHYGRSDSLRSTSRSRPSTATTRTGSPAAIGVARLVRDFHRTLRTRKLPTAASAT